jgi:hypothetical protein
MRTPLGIVLATLALAIPSKAADDTTAVLDKAAEALGGREKLASVKAATWSTKGKITINGSDSPFTAKSVFQGHDRRRAEFNIDLGGNPIQVVVVVKGDKGWRQINGMTEELSGDELDRERRTAYLEWTTATVLPLKQAPFKTEPAGEERVNDKPADGVKVVGPDGKPHTVYFDRETHLPVRLVSVATDFAGEATHETNYSDYKEFNGVRKATKVKVKRDGQDFVDAELTEFKVIDAPDAKTFDKPE